MPNTSRAPLAVTIGEPAGIGPDLILRLYVERQVHDLPPFLVYGSIKLMQERAARLGLQVNFANVDVHTANEMFPTALPIVDLAENLTDQPGVLRSETATLVIEAIALATADVRSGACRALVTAPIHKSILYDAGFNHPGHTEFLATLCAENDITPRPVMMLAHDCYRVVPTTVHVPLADVPSLITTAGIIETAHIVNNDLQQRFAISSPRLAIAGLNPHAGEDGTIGLEDREIIAPAVAALCAEGINAVGPLSADTLFYPPHWQQYDAVIAMYHDQALIPIKTIGFDKGVNITLGLPIIRTSPDHGTAISLAGTGTASISSMLAAIRMADQMAQR